MYFCPESADILNTISTHLKPIIIINCLEFGIIRLNLFQRLIVSFNNCLILIVKIVLRHIFLHAFQIV